MRRSGHLTFQASVVSGLLAALLASSPVQAQADPEWSALKGHRVEVLRVNGEKQTGVLALVTSSGVILRTDDGLVSLVETGKIRSIRDLGPAAAPLPPAPALGAPPSPPAMAPPGLPDRDFAELFALVFHAEGDKLQALLESKAPSLSQTQRLLLLTTHRKDDKAATGFALNFLIPGLGSLIQGDYAWAAGILGTAGVGGALMALAQGGWGKAGVGEVLLVAAGVANFVRPWFYEHPKNRLLKRYLAGSPVRIQPFVLPAPMPAGNQGRALSAWVGGLSLRY